MSDLIQQGSLQIEPELYDLLERDIAPGTGVEPTRFWQALEKIVRDLGPRNRELRDHLLEKASQQLQQHSQ